MVHSNAWLWLLVNAVSLGGCGSQRDQSPPIKGCNATNCDVVAIVAGGSAGGSGAGADSGVSTSGVSLSINVVQFTGSNTGLDAWSPQNVQQLSGTFAVKVSGINQGVLSDTGTSPLPFSNVLADGNGWVSVTPSTDSGFFPGLHAIPLDTGISVTVPLLRTVDLDLVYTLLSSKALAFDTARPQLIIKFVDAGGHGVSGLHVSDMGGQTMAYATSTGTWVEATSSTSTDASGRVMGVNLPISSTPGYLLSVSATGVNLQGTVQSAYGRFPIQSGFVTYGTILFQ